MNRTLVIATACLLTATAQLGTAQITSSRTTSGTFGSRTLGNTVSGASGQVNRNQGLTQTGEVTASGALQRDAGGFVGASSQNMAGVLGTQGVGFGQTGIGGFGSRLGGGFGNQFGFGANRGQQQLGAENLGATTPTRGNLRIPMQIGFARPRSIATADAASLRLSERFKNIRQVDAVGVIDVASVGRTVVLRGTVATVRARDLAERVALLEPGVSEVQNELTVLSPPESAELPPLE